MLVFRTCFNRIWLFPVDSVCIVAVSPAWVFTSGRLWSAHGCTRCTVKGSVILEAGLRTMYRLFDANVDEGFVMEGGEISSKVPKASSASMTRSVILFRLFRSYLLNDLDFNNDYYTRNITLSVSAVQSTGFNSIARERETTTTRTTNRITIHRQQLSSTLWVWSLIRVSLPARLCPWTTLAKGHLTMVIEEVSIYLHNIKHVSIYTHC